MIARIAVVSAALGLGLAAALAGSGSARTQAVQPWVFNGSVNALALSGHTLYVGGRFTQVSPRTGPLLGFSAGSGGRLQAFPAVEDGTVFTIAGDGKGGWFVGGEFTRIGGFACPRLAHVTSAMAVDRGFCPRPNGPVFSLAEDGSTLYVGGSFDHVGGAARSYLAAVDAGTGHVTPSKPPALDGEVSEIAIRSGVLYLLGGFSSAGGKSRFSLAAVDARTAAVTGWDPKAPPYGGHGDPSVQAIAASTSAIYVGGFFDHVGGKNRAELAALDPVTGHATGWAPRGPWVVEALAVAGGRLYVGGTLHASGDGKSSLAAYDLASGKRAAWNPPVGPGGVSSLGVGGSRVYVDDDRLEAFDASSGKRAGWNPPLPNAGVAAIAPSGQTVAVGGAFTGAGGAARDSLAAIDLRTGRPTGWHPAVGNADRQPEIDAIALSGHVLYLGGAFDHLGGKTRHLVGAVDTTTGRPTPWAPPVGGEQVLAVVASGSSVFVGGFGVASGFAASGELHWNSPPTGSTAVVQSIAVAGRTVYVGGTLDIIGGASRQGLAALDALNGSATPWSPRLRSSDGDVEVDALALSGTTLFVGGTFDSVGGARRLNLAAFDRASGKWTTWAPRTKLPTVYAITPTASAVYVGGDGGIEAFDPRTGASLGWHPAITQGQGFTLAHVIVVVGSTVYVGGDGGLDVFAAPR